MYFEINRNILSMGIMTIAALFLLTSCMKGARKAARLKKSVKVKIDNVTKPKKKMKFPSGLLGIYKIDSAAGCRLRIRIFKGSAGLRYQLNTRQRKAAGHLGVSRSDGSTVATHIEIGEEPCASDSRLPVPLWAACWSPP